MIYSEENWKTIPEEEVDEIENLFRKHYFFPFVRVGIAVLDDRTLEDMGKEVDECKKRLSEKLKYMRETERPDIKKLLYSDGYHSSKSWNETIHYGWQSEEMKRCIEKQLPDTENKKMLLRFFEGKNWFILVRKEHCKNPYHFLENVFHEFIHLIEFRTSLKIFRGKSIEQENKDQEEIVRCLATEFMKQKKSTDSINTIYPYQNSHELDETK